MFVPCELKLLKMIDKRQINLDLQSIVIGFFLVSLYITHFVIVIMTNFYAFEHFLIFHGFIISKLNTNLYNMHGLNQNCTIFHRFECFQNIFNFSDIFLSNAN